MRRVEKGAEPESLLRYRKQKEPAPSYDGFREKQALRERLADDQGGLCCYCMTRIRPDEEGMKVEHFRSQHRHPTLQLLWTNLLGACRDLPGARRSDQTCDSRKGDAELSIDPLTLRSDQFVYEEDGRVLAVDTSLQAELDAVLGLNVTALMRARREAWFALRTVVARKLGARSTWSGAALQREVDALRASRPLPEFLGLFEFWLERLQRKRRTSPSSPK
ncbi:MAG: TIGR02646 family protein [Deltaproteobacteria bacterium]|nr:TIGR02646 family protein [Nannocystaceae bacterium]